MRGELLLDRDHGLRDGELVGDQSVARGRRRANPASSGRRRRGRRLDLTCVGSGRPTVVLEAGFPGDSSTWRDVPTATGPDDTHLRLRPRRARQQPADERRPRRATRSRICNGSLARPAFGRRTRWSVTPTRWWPLLVATLGPESRAAPAVGRPRSPSDCHRVSPRLRTTRACTRPTVSGGFAVSVPRTRSPRILDACGRLRRR
jgi:hypothetical protein